MRRRAGQPALEVAGRVLMAAVALGLVVSALHWPSRSPTLHGMFRGFDAGSGMVDRYAEATAVPVVMGHEFGSDTRWSYFEDGTNFDAWAAWVAASPGRRFSYSAPLLTREDAGDYAGLNAGLYDVHFTNLGRAFQSRPALHRSVIRLGWEFNGATFPWALPADSTDEQLAAYTRAYNRAARLIAAQFPSAQFEWCPNAHLDNANRTLSDMYPGDDFVDYVGLAVYDYYLRDGSPTAAQRRAYLMGGDDTNGMLDQLALARSRDKPIAYTEWGLWPSDSDGGGGDRPEFVTMMLDFMVEHGAAYSVYNNVSATQDHRLETYPASRSVYLDRFADGFLR